MMITTRNTRTEKLWRYDHGLKNSGWRQKQKINKYKTMFETLMLILGEVKANYSIAAAAFGCSIGIGLLGMKAVEATGRNPGAAGNILTISIILAALIEGIVFFAIFLA